LQCRQQQLQRRRALQAEQEGDALLGTVAGSDYLDLENTCRKADFYLTLLLAVDTAAWNGTQEAAACYNGEAAALASGLCELGTSLVGPRTRSDYLSSFYTASFPNGTISEVYGHVEMIRPEYAVLPSSSEGVLYATAGLEADCAAGSGHDCLKWYKVCAPACWCQWLAAYQCRMFGLQQYRAAGMLTSGACAPHAAARCCSCPSTRWWSLCATRSSFAFVSCLCLDGLLLLLGSFENSASRPCQSGS
jgi:hypothetical protein